MDRLSTIFWTKSVENWRQWQWEWQGHGGCWLVPRQSIALRFCSLTPQRCTRQRGYAIACFSAAIKQKWCALVLGRPAPVGTNSLFQTNQTNPTQPHSPGGGTERRKRGASSLFVVLCHTRGKFFQSQMSTNTPCFPILALFACSRTLVSDKQAGRRACKHLQRKEELQGPDLVLSLPTDGSRGRARKVPEKKRKTQKVKKWWRRTVLRSGERKKEKRKKKTYPPIVVVNLEKDQGDEERGLDAIDCVKGNG